MHATGCYRRGDHTRWALAMTVLGLSVTAGAADPVVSALSASQRAGTKLVDMSYTLTADTNCTGSVQISTNNGATYDLPAASFSGDGVGAGVAPGTGKQIVWDAGADWNGRYSDTVWFRVTADDGIPGTDYLVIDISSGPSASAYPVSYRSGVPSGGWTEAFKTTNIVLRKVPAGSFTMGAPEAELGWSPDEIQHEVTLTEDFYIGVFEVTQKQWERVMGTWPSYFVNVTYRDSRPVECVSYYDVRENPNGSPISPHWPQSDQVHADSFMGKLRSKTGLATLDLPTESQWEYACRAGTTTALNSGSNLLSQSSDTRMNAVGRYWFNGGSSVNSNSTPSNGTALVGSYLGNAWGLYDMHGNVWEWCLDWYDDYPEAVTNPPGAASGSWRVDRGGSFYAYAWNCRSARRMYTGAAQRASITGFRIAMTVPPAQPPLAVDGIHSAEVGPVTVDTLNEGGTIGLSTCQLAYAATYGGAAPAAQTLILNNAGRIAFNYSNTVTYGSESSWFTLEPATGTLAGGVSHVLTGSVYNAGLTAGVFVATNTVSAPEATNTPALLVAVLTVSKASQSIAFPAIPDQVVTNTVTLAGNASSGLPVTFAVRNGPAQISGGTTLTFTGAGVVSIAASQTGDANWNPAPEVTNTFTVTLLNQEALLFAPISPQTYDTTQELHASGGSGAGALAFAVQSGPGQITGGTNLLITAGTGIVIVVATKAADAVYAATAATGQVEAVRADQTVVFPPIPNQVATSTVALIATALSGLEANFTVGGGPASIVGGTTLVFSGAGLVSVVARQAGDFNWNPAPGVTNTFTVTPARAAVTLQAMTQTYNGSPRTVTVVTTPVGLPVTVTYNGSATAPVNAGTYTVIGTVIHAQYQGGKTGTLTVAKAGQAISFPAIPDQVVSSVVALAATASSGLPVTFAIVSGPGAIAGANTLSFGGTGRVTVAANQAGNANWKAAAQRLQTVTVNPARPRLFGMLKDFDGDGKADPATYEERTGTWTVKLSTAGYATFTFTGLLGGPGWQAGPADYDGDGLVDPAIYLDTIGNWTLLQSGSGYAMLARNAFLGAAGWAPISEDFDGDGKADYGVYQETTGTWKIRLSSGGYFLLTLTGFLGGPGKTPIAGDFEGDRLSDPAVYTRASGAWQVLLSSAGYSSLDLPRFLGGAGWDPVPGDYDGDGLADPAVRKSDGSIWRLRLSGSGYVPLDIPFGL